MRPRWRFAFFFAMEKEGRRPQAVKSSYLKTANTKPGYSYPMKKDVIPLNLYFDLFLTFAKVGVCTLSLIHI